MQAQRRLVRSHYEKQSLSFGRKAAGLGSGGDHAGAVKADRRDRQPKRFAQRRIGDRYGLATTCASDFALHGGRNRIAPSRVDGRRRYHDVNGMALARKSDIDEVGANHRGQRGCGAVGDPAGLVILPHRRQRRQGDQVADESPEFKDLRVRLRRRGCGVVDTLAPFGHRGRSLCGIELRRGFFRSRSCSAVAGLPYGIAFRRREGRTARDLKSHWMSRLGRSVLLVASRESDISTPYRHRGYSAATGAFSPARMLAAASRRRCEFD